MISIAIFTTGGTKEEVLALIEPHYDKMQQMFEQFRRNQGFTHWSDEYEWRYNVGTPANEIDFKGIAEKDAKQKEKWNRFLASSGLAAKHDDNGKYKEQGKLARRIEGVTGYTTVAVVTPDGRWHQSEDSPDNPLEALKKIAIFLENYNDNFIQPAITNGWFLSTMKLERVQVQ